MGVSTSWVWILLFHHADYILFLFTSMNHIISYSKVTKNKTICFFWVPKTWSCNPTTALASNKKQKYSPVWDLFSNVLIVWSHWHAVSAKHSPVSSRQIACGQAGWGPSSTMLQEGQATYFQLRKMKHKSNMAKVHCKSTSEPGLECKLLKLRSDGLILLLYFWKSNNGKFKFYMTMKTHNE